MGPSDLTWMSLLKQSDHVAVLLNPLSGSSSPNTVVSAIKYLKNTFVSRSPIGRLDFLGDTQVQNKLWFMLDAYSTNNKASPFLPLAQYIVGWGYNNPIGSKTPSENFWLTNNSPDFTEWPRPFLIGSNCSHFMFLQMIKYLYNFTLPCHYPEHSFCLECASLPQMSLSVWQTPTYPLKPCLASLLILLTSICTISMPCVCFYHCPGHAHCNDMFTYSASPKSLSSLRTRPCHTHHSTPMFGLIPDTWHLYRNWMESRFFSLSF